MYKISMRLMGPPEASPSKVKEVVLEVEAKTKLSDLTSYLVDLGKIPKENTAISLTKGGDFLTEETSISQILRFNPTKLTGIQLYVYEISDARRIQLSPKKGSSKEENSTSNIMIEPKVASIESETNKGCCCIIF